MRYNFINSRIDCLTLEETIMLIKKNITSKKFSYQVSVNAEKINLMTRNKSLLEIVNNAQIINADGVSVVFGGRFLGIPIPERVTGIDIYKRLLKEASIENYTIYFLGATESSLLRMIANIKRDYPEINIVGYRNGYFKDDEEEMVVKEIRNKKPDLLFLGFSSPKKEEWIRRYSHNLNAKFIMGVGGSFDILSGKTKRAPVIFQKLGLEWLFRFIQEPIRLFKRYTFGNFTYLLLLVRAKFNLNL